jgi:hypothetical protein
VSLLHAVVKHVKTLLSIFILKMVNMSVQKSVLPLWEPPGCLSSSSHLGVLDNKFQGHPYSNLGKILEMVNTTEALPETLADVCNRLSNLSSSRAKAFIVPGATEYLWWEARECKEALEIAIGTRLLVSVEHSFKGCNCCPVIDPMVKSIVVPYPTYFHATDDNSILKHQSSVFRRSRPWLMTYWGGSHGKCCSAKVRDALRLACAHEPTCKKINVKNETHGLSKLPVCASQSKVTSAFALAYLHSEFCLSPPGDTPTRQMTFDALLSGCIPVFFSSCLHPWLIHETAYYPFLPRYHRTHFGAGDWAVVLDSRRISEGQESRAYLRDSLRNISTSKREEMRSIIVNHLPRLQYSANPLHTFDDAGAVYARLLRDINKKQM